MTEGRVRVVETPEGRLPEAWVLASLREAFGHLADGSGAQPPQLLTLLPGGGDVIAYQGVLPGYYGVKVSPYLPDAAGGGLVTAWTLLLSTETGRPLLLCDSKWLTTERTAATTALAVDLLAAPGATRLAVIGGGPIARAHLRYARAVRDFTEVRAYSPGLASGARPSTFDGEVTLAASAADAAQDADVVLLCTSSATTVLDVTALAAGALVTAVSTNAPGAHEIDPAALAGLDVYADYRRTVPSVAGEMTVAVREGLWSPDAIRGDLPELVTGAAPAPSGDRVAFFRSVGLGIEDVAIAKLLLE